MPTFGTPAASTAAPHPPRTSQNVPMNSAASLRDKSMAASLRSLIHFGDRRSAYIRRAAERVGLEVNARDLILITHAVHPAFEALDEIAQESGRVLVLQMPALIEQSGG